jgi:hypothetical protein
VEAKTGWQFTALATRSRNISSIPGSSSTTSMRGRNLLNILLLTAGIFAPTPSLKFQI